MKVINTGRPEVVDFKGEFFREVMILDAMIPDPLKDEEYREQLRRARPLETRFPGMDVWGAINGLLGRIGFWQIRNIDEKRE